MKREKDPDVFKIGGEHIKRGERKKVYLDVASLYDFTKLTIPIEVIRGKKRGPVMFICAAIHGDEINGVEIIRRILKRKLLNSLKGTLILVPIVNVFGFNNKSRYLPDRRDLNRSFPGKKNGSLASRLAHIFMTEIVRHCTHGIDLHTGAIHRTNLPQIRASLDDPGTKALAEAFNVPVIVNSELRDGSLREAARKKHVSMLLFEGGEALRFNEDIINVGVKGCISVMRKIGMLAPSKKIEKGKKVFSAKNSYWLRSSVSGAFRVYKKIGDPVFLGEVLATISDPFGENPQDLIADSDGIIIGASMIPLVNKGDAMFHIATFSDVKRVCRIIDSLDVMF